MKTKDNPKSSLTYKHYDQKISIKTNHSDLDMEEFYQTCKQLALAVGYASSTVEEYFNE